MNTVTPPLASSRLLLSAGTILNATFRQRVSAAKQAGFDAISLSPQQYLQARRKEKLSLENMQAILAEHNIAMDEVDPLMDWFGEDASPSEHLIYEIAGGLNARSINVSPAFVPAMSINEVTEKYARVCQRASAYQLRVNFEFLPWTAIGDLDSALKVVDGSGQGNAGLMLDFWHFFHSDGNDAIAAITALVPEQAQLITGIQVSDSPLQSVALGFKDKLSLARLMISNLRDGFKVMGSKQFFKTTASAGPYRTGANALMAETIAARLLPGQGEMPLKQLLHALDAVGAQPTVGLEVFSLQLNRTKPIQAAAVVMQAYRELTVGNY